MTTVRVDEYVLDTLMRDLVGHDRKPSAFLVYLHLWYRTAGMRTRTVAASHQSIADDVGLSRSAVQSAIDILSKRRLLRCRRSSPTATPEYTVQRPWHRKGRTGRLS